MLPKRTITERKPRTKTAEQALASLMRLCARAEKCEADARRLMRGWGVAEQEIEPVVARLVRDRFIDDSRYAAMYVREKANLSGWGAYKIRTFLQRKQIDKATIDEALQQIDPARAADRLIERLQRKARTTKAKSPYELRTKLIRYALSLGFGYEAVQQAVGALCTADQEENVCDEFFD